MYRRIQSRRRFLTCAIASVFPAITLRRARAQTSVALTDVERSARALDQLHSFILVRGGDTILAMAPRGGGLDRPANVKSVSKTLVSTLIGIAIDRDVLSGVDARLLPLLGRAAEGGKAEITLADCLTMRSGLERTSGPAYGSWVGSPNWVANALDRPLLSRPGARFAYSTGNYHLLGVALARSAGSSLHALARDWLGDPLEVDIPAWTRDPQGYFLGGNEMAMTPRALSRFGQMILAGGVWNNREIVSQTWISAALTARARSPFSGDQYGYGWFLTDVAGRRAAYARGYGGQMLMVVPEEDLVMTVTSDPTRPARSRGYFGDLKALAALAVRAV